MERETREKIVSEDITDDSGVFSFRKTKKIGTLTINRVESEVSVNDGKVVIESITKLFGIFRGKVKSHYIHLKEIQSIDIKRKMSIYYLIIALFFVFFSICSNPLYLLLSLFSIWAGLSTNVVIKPSIGKGIMFKSDTKEEAEAFIEYINCRIGKLNSI